MSEPDNVLHDRSREELTEDTRQRKKKKLNAEVTPDTKPGLFNSGVVN